LHEAYAASMDLSVKQTPALTGRASNRGDTQRNSKLEPTRKIINPKPVLIEEEPTFERIEMISDHGSAPLSMHDEADFYVSNP
jgi:hypothetical protein